MLKKLVASLSIMALFLAVSCSKSEKQAPQPEQKVTKENTVTELKGPTEPKTSTVDPAKTYTATIKTSKGDIVCELFAADAPLSVTNFKQLADIGFYKGLNFHRVVPDFVIQGGDPQGTGAGGPGYTIPAEIKRKHTAGALAWARTGDEVNPQRRSSGSQFYITYKPVAFLDNQYTVFGQVTSGMDAVNRITQGDKIIDVIVEEK